MLGIYAICKLISFILEKTKDSAIPSRSDAASQGLLRDHHIVYSCCEFTAGFECLSSGTGLARFEIYCV
jgi:hypothetical protein